MPLEIGIILPLSKVLSAFLKKYNFLIKKRQDFCFKNVLQRETSYFQNAFVLDF